MFLLLNTFEKAWPLNVNMFSDKIFIACKNIFTKDSCFLSPHFTNLPSNDLYAHRFR